MGLSTVRRGVRAASRRRSTGASVGFRTSARGNDEMTGNKASAAIAVPGPVQAGDVMLVVAAQNTGANTFGISGGGAGATWTKQFGPVTLPANNLRAYVWTARATGASAGSTITVSSNGSSRFPALLVVESGVTETGMVTSSTQVTSANTSHGFSSVTVPSPGGYMLLGIGAFRTGTDTAATITTAAGSTVDDQSNTAAPSQPNLTVAVQRANSTVGAGTRTPAAVTASPAATSLLFTVALAPA